MFVFSSPLFQPTVEKAQLHALHGDQLIQSNHYAVDSIRPKCVELRRVCDDFSNEAKKKTDILSKSLQIHLGIDKVSFGDLWWLSPSFFFVFCFFYLTSRALFSGLCFE